MKKMMAGLVFILLLTAPMIFAAEAAPNFCPVSGDKTNGKITYEYQGVTHSFCCPKCARAFKKNPEKYLSGHSEMAEMGHMH